MKKKRKRTGAIKPTSSEPSTICEPMITEPDMASSAAINVFCEALKEHLEAGKMTDAVIRCEGQKFKVHALILSSQSEFFAKAFNGTWKESKGMKEVSLKEVGVDIVKAMLRFMYSFDYNGPDHVSALLFDAKVYSAADRYLMPHLKDHAKGKFNAAIDVKWNTAEHLGDLESVIKEVYSSTPHTDRGLRDLVVSSCHGRLATISKHESFRTILDETFGFAGDLVLFGANYTMPPVDLCGNCEPQVCGYCGNCY